MTGRARLFAVVVAIGAAVAATAAGSAAMADEDTSSVGNAIHEQLTGYEEDPGVVSTAGNGRFEAHIDEAAGEISYRLSYADLEGTVQQAHIHFGGKAQSGGISVFLCTNLGNGPAGTQLCPASPGAVEGTIRAVDVIGPAPQGITAGQFGELVAAIRAHKTYVNVHSSMWPGGEVRAQLGHDH